MKVLVIIGTRPEVIKMAPVVHELLRYPKKFNMRLCFTGQHREMVYQIANYFNLNPDYDLKVMKKSQSLSSLTEFLVKKLQSVAEDFKPDIILVQGDTTSAFIGGLIGYYNSIKVGHVEAGLRTQNKFAPFPEEMNRRLIGVLADYHFAPTERAAEALRVEGVNENLILITGNTVIDSLFYTLGRIKSNPPELGELEKVINDNNKIVLVTGHRRENFGKGFENICLALHELAKKFPKVHFIYPVHLNPKVQRPVYETLGDLTNIHLTAPIGYIPFVRLMSAAHIILTDSGGIQEEAPSLGKPVLIMREVTERPEAVEAGTALLVGTDRTEIVNQVSRLLTDYGAWENMSQIKNPFGDGKAAWRIVNYLCQI